MNLKKSKFNVIIPYRDNTSIIFNSLSGAIGKLDEESVSKYKSDLFFDLFDSKELEMLKKKGILIPTDFDELRKIALDRASGINNKNVKHFRIWTTTSCNAGCYYCFEKGIACQTMNIETANNLVNYICGMIDNNDELQIEWFGGEPLLNTKVIDYVSKELTKRIANKLDSLQVYIITNGSLITPEIAKKMKETWKIRGVQITLDGYDDYYDSVKKYKNPKIHNFFTTVSNIQLLLEQGIHVSVRMNYVNNNYDSLRKLIIYLHERFNEKKGIRFYIYPLWSSLNGDFISNASADLRLIELYKLLVSYNMTTIQSIARLNYRKHQCRACNKYSFNILPDGRIGKCSEVFNQIIGNVNSGIYNKDVYNLWTDNDIEEKCKECVLLPLCQGGCRASRFSNMTQCYVHKPIFEELLIWYVEYLDGQLAQRHKDLLKAEIN